MNIGYEQIANLMRSQLISGGGSVVKFKGGDKKYFKDTAKMIIDLLEKNGDNMQTDMKAVALSRGISPEVIKYHDRICRAFSFSAVQLDPLAIEIYGWMIKQEAKGQTVEAFAEWARKPDRAQYINKYRKDAGNFKNDWALAFAGKERSMFEDVAY